jgi:hypothetical protein
MTKRRKILTYSAGMVALSGCISGSNEGGAEASKNQESFDPSNYYGLPKCDGSRPVQLIDVQGAEGIIRNMSTDDLIVFVSHGPYQSNGDYCDGHLLEGADQIAYKTDGEVRPTERIKIRALEDTESNRERVCYSFDIVGDGGDGCVDPGTFRG